MNPFRPVKSIEEANNYLIGLNRELNLLEKKIGSGGTTTVTISSGGGGSTTVVTGSTVKYGMKIVSSSGNGTITYTAFSPAPSTNNEPMLMFWDAAGNFSPLRATAYSNGSISYTVDTTGVILWVVGY